MSIIPQVATYKYDPSPYTLNLKRMEGNAMRRDIQNALSSPITIGSLALSILLVLGAWWYSSHITDGHETDSELSELPKNATEESRLLRTQSSDNGTDRNEGDKRGRSDTEIHTRSAVPSQTEETIQGEKTAEEPALNEAVIFSFADGRPYGIITPQRLKALGIPTFIPKGLDLEVPIKEALPPGTSVFVSDETTVFLLPEREAFIREEYTTTKEEALYNMTGTEVATAYDQQMDLGRQLSFAKTEFKKAATEAERTGDQQALQRLERADAILTEKEQALEASFALYGEIGKGGMGNNVGYGERPSLVFYVLPGPNGLRLEW